MKKTQLTKVGEHMASMIMARLDDNFDYDEIMEMISSYKTIADDVQNGEYLIYFDQCREFLRDLYNETEDEANKYTNTQVWEQYKHCLAIMSNHKKYITSPIIEWAVIRTKEEIATLSGKKI